MSDEKWLKKQIEIQNRSFYLRSKFNAFLFSITGVFLVLVKIIAIDANNLVGLIFAGLGVLSIAIGITGYIQGHHLVYPDKWYYSPKATLKRVAIKGFGLF